MTLAEPKLAGSLTEENHCREVIDESGENASKSQQDFYQAEDGAGGPAGEGASGENQNDEDHHEGDPDVDPEDPLYGLE